jgi:hypothetical protein
MLLETPVGKVDVSEHTACTDLTGIGRIPLLLSPQPQRLKIPLGTPPAKLVHCGIADLDRLLRAGVDATHTECAVIPKDGASIDVLDVIHRADPCAQTATLTALVSLEPGARPVASHLVQKGPQPVGQRDADA